MSNRLAIIQSADGEADLVLWLLLGDSVVKRISVTSIEEAERRKSCWLKNATITTLLDSPEFVKVRSKRVNRLGMLRPRVGDLWSDVTNKRVCHVIDTFYDKQNNLIVVSCWNSSSDPRVWDPVDVRCQSLSVYHSDLNNANAVNCNRNQGPKVQEEQINPIPRSAPSFRESLVRDFHKSFGLSNDNPSNSLLPKTFWISFLLEEVLELAKSMGMNVEILPPDGSGIRKRLRVTQFSNHTDFEGVADATGDIEYVLHGINIMYGFPSDEIFAEIHKSNLSKKNPDGTFSRDSLGKVIKGPNYTKPDIASVFAKAKYKKGEQ